MFSESRGKLLKKLAFAHHMTRSAKNVKQAFTQRPKGHELRPNDVGLIILGHMDGVNGVCGAAEFTYNSMLDSRFEVDDCRSMRT